MLPNGAPIFWRRLYGKKRDDLADPLDRPVNTDPDADTARSPRLEGDFSTHGMTLAELLGFEE